MESRLVSELRHLVEIILEHPGQLLKHNIYVKKKPLLLPKNSGLTGAKHKKRRDYLKLLRKFMAREGSPEKNISNPWSISAILSSNI